MTGAASIESQEVITAEGASSCLRLNVEESFPIYMGVQRFLARFRYCSRDFGLVGPYCSLFGSS